MEFPIELVEVFSQGMHFDVLAVVDYGFFFRILSRFQARGIDGRGGGVRARTR